VKTGAGAGADAPRSAAKADPEATIAAMLVVQSQRLTSISMPSNGAWAPRSYRSLMRRIDIALIRFFPLGCGGATACPRRRFGFSN
jgi:hypothetical protein